MSSGVATNKDGISAQMEQIGVTSEHFGDIEGINKYFDDNKVNQLFNVRQIYRAEVFLDSREPSLYGDFRIFETEKLTDILVYRSS